MGRESKLLIFMIMSFMQSCLAGNSTTPQTSRNIEEAKENGTFVASFHVDEGRFDSIIVESTWVEKVWFRETNGHKTIVDGCKLCFKIKQQIGSKFLLKNVLKWDMREVNTSKSVGVEISKKASGVSGIYVYELDSCSLPDVLAFDLYVQSENGKTKVGNLVFKQK